MGNITFKVCTVIINKIEQNYENYSVELEQIQSIDLDGSSNSCVIKMKFGSTIEIKYFDNKTIL